MPRLLGHGCPTLGPRALLEPLSATRVDGWCAAAAAARDVRTEEAKGTPGVGSKQGWGLGLG